mmetsp:Transcript_24416/g.41350  ORF Transcript_24416/g.41350 Transcript_24416/m.41350 type:complete len:489 (+) Transcript_24416:87-1553(+)
MDFTSAVSKFEKDAEKRRKAAKEKQRNEAIARRRQAVLDKERQEQALLRKAEMEREEAEKEEKAREEARATGGVSFHQELRVVTLQGEDDRVVLPQSALEALMNQNAFDHGPMCFRIWPSSSRPDAASHCQRVSHCGVREFTAVEGTVQLPKKVLDSLGLADQVAQEESQSGQDDEQQLQEKATSVEPVHVTLKYVLLSKVSSVRIQPVRNLFSQVGPIKLVLEENLRHHSSLSLGDVLTVYYRGSEHTLVVKDLTLESDQREEKDDDVMDEEDVSDVKHTKDIDKGYRGGTLINTDVVVDIDVSEEYLQQQQQEQAEAQKVQASKVVGGAATGRTTGGEFPSSSGHRLGGSSVSRPHPPHETAAPTTTSSTKAECGPVDYDLSLDEEPAAGASHVITCKVKTPQGKTFTRRFDKAKPFRQLFTFVRSVLQQHQLPSPQQGEVLQLSTRQPARKFSELDGAVCSSPLPTFLSAGFESSKNEMFFVAFV